MNTLCVHREICRLCESRHLACVLKLEPTPPANAFVPPELVTTPQQRFPLDVWMCRACKHVQLLDVVDAGELFSDYVYVSGTSPVFVAHFRKYASSVQKVARLAPGDLVVDVGSNDGTLLRFFVDAGQRVLGVDPADAIAQAATRSGIETLPEFFTVPLAERVRTQYGQARVITANNVFAHVDDLKSFVDGVRTLLAPDGLFVFEVSYLLDVVDKLLFDTIYHEHLDYHAVGPLVPFFRSRGMELIDVERIETHGGSIRGWVAHSSARATGASIAQLTQLEASFGIDREDTFRRFEARIGQRRDELRGLIRELRASGKRIAGFGAPAKATTLMHHFQLDSSDLEFIADDSPMKQNLFTPGLHTPVLPSSALYERRPDYVVVLAWNFAESIVRNHDKFLQLGGHFIVPLPQLEVI